MPILDHDNYGEVSPSRYGNFVYTHWPLGDFIGTLDTQFSILMIDGLGISYDIALRWMPMDLTDDESALVQVMAWCYQAMSHFLSQCWPIDLCHHMMSLGHNKLIWI